MKRLLAGLATVTAIAAVVALAVGLFRDSFTKTVPVTVISDRAGLVMNPDAKVKMNGAQVGKVASIEVMSNGTAALHLDLDPSLVDIIPANVGAEITSSTVFGAFATNPPSFDAPASGGVALPPFLSHSDPQPSPSLYAGVWGLLGVNGVGKAGSRYCVPCVPVRVSRRLSSLSPP